MKKVKLLMRKCKSFSMELAKPSFYTNLRSNSTREHHFRSSHHHHHHKLQQQEDQDQENQQDRDKEDQDQETIFVGSTRKRYAIRSKYLTHPLLRALMEKKKTLDQNDHGGDLGEMILVNCEVVLFDHLLWIIDNADPNLSFESFQELAEFYVS